MDVEFTFYGILHETDRRESLDGIEVSVSGSGRDVADVYEAHADAIWALIGEYYDRIVTEDYEIDRWPDVREHACGDCDYREMCAPYLAAEVRAGD
jgi:putative RecB family exonuclease